MKTDRELLELAAKAAGIVSLRWGLDDPDRQISGEGQFIGATWNPLTDDGDALRLAVKLELSLRLCHSENAVRVYGSPYGAIDEGVRGDHDTATRRAIVRAAAAIGEYMP